MQYFIFSSFEYELSSIQNAKSHKHLYRLYENNRSGNSGDEESYDDLFN